jgi:hypothetical protein
MTNESRPTLRSYGYLAAILILGISIGLLLYPLLTYPAIWQWVLIGISLVLIALCAPFLGKRR